MKIRTMVATSAAGLAMAFGILGGGLATAAADPLPGHGPNCSGMHDGSMCSDPDGIGRFYHLDFGEPQSGPAPLDLDYRAN